MATQNRLVRRVGSLELRVGALEKSTAEIVEQLREISGQIRPLRDIVVTVNVVQKVAAFLTVFATVAGAAAHWFIH